MRLEIGQTLSDFLAVNVAMAEGGHAPKAGIMVDKV